MLSSAANRTIWDQRELTPCYITSCADLLNKWYELGAGAHRTNRKSRAKEDMIFGFFRIFSQDGTEMKEGRGS